MKKLHIFFNRQKVHFFVNGRILCHIIKRYDWGFLQANFTQWNAIYGCWNFYSLIIHHCLWGCGDKMIIINRKECIRWRKINVYVMTSFYFQLFYGLSYFECVFIGCSKRKKNKWEKFSYWKLLPPHKMTLF